jgi:adenylate kinase
MNYCLIGAPGVGKGTFSKLLISRLKLHHISVGDIVRNEIKQETIVGKKVQKYVECGHLIPDEVVNEVVHQELHKFNFSNCLLDGFPRTTVQADILDNYLKNPLRAVHIQLDKSVAVEKLLGRQLCVGCGRGFNKADIRRDGYDMPAILPGEYEACPRGAEECRQHRSLHVRSDDTRETILRRFEVFESETLPLLRFYENSDRLRTLDVKRGVGDIEELIRIMTS